jgi:anti-sigma factor RsiW
VSSGCSEILDLLAPFADGELQEAERENVARHVAGCASCADEVDFLRRLDRATAEAYTAPPVSEAVWEGVWSGIRKETVEIKRRRFGGWLVGAAAAAVVVAVIGLSLLYRMPGSTTIPAAAALQPGVVESVEVTSEGYIAALYVAEGEVPAIFLTEVD